MMIYLKAHTLIPRQRPPSVDVHSRLRIRANGRHHQATHTTNSNRDQAHAGREAQAFRVTAHILTAI